MINTDINWGRGLRTGGGTCSCPAGPCPHPIGGTY